MIEPLENYIPPDMPQTEQKRRERCTAALAHLRAAWRLLEDAGVAERFRESLMLTANNIKTAMGGEGKP